MNDLVGSSGRHTRVFRTGSVLLRRFLALLLSVLLAFQPVLLRAQELSVDPAASASQQAQIGAAANGVPLVNIATPNAAGLSHNRYANFNVGPEGLILNNSTEALARSSLGGLLQGNANLKSTGAARVILNEVTGANRSQLKGATEVFGTGADLVIANPNGLTCDGCGFINTPRVTLSTGTPALGADGSLDGLAVSRGDVTIGANGADLGQSDLFEIISRSISVNGPVSARGELALVAGHNRYGYGDGSVTALSSDGNEPALAIDSSALGGMYAGRIRLVASDRGAGVNMQGDMAANSGEMTLSADGKLTLAKGYAKGTITARSSRDRVEIANTLFSDTAIVLKGTTGVTVKDNALVAASGNVSLEGSQIALGAGAAVAAGMSAGGQLGTSGDLSLTGDTITTGKGLLTSGGLLSITANIADLSRAADDGSVGVSSRGAIVIDAATVKATHARITSAANLTLRSAAALRIEAGQFLAGGSLLASAASLTSNASLQAVSAASLTASNGDIVQNGTVQGNAGTQLTASAKVSNSGQILSPGQVSVSAGTDFSNAASGALIANSGLVLQAGTVSNDGTVAAQGGDLSITSQGTLGNGGKLIGQDAATLTASGAVTNSGTLQIGNALFLNTLNALTNSGTIDAGEATIEAASLANQGLITSHSGAVSTTLSGALSNSGELSAKTDLTLGANGGVSLTGKTLAARTLTLTGTNGGRAGNVTTGADAIVSGVSGVTLKATSLTNAGKIGSGNGAVSANLSGNLVNSNLIHATGDQTLTVGGALTNAAGAEISANNQLTLTATGALSNSGKLLAANSLQASTGATLSNSSAAAMQGGMVNLNAASLSNDGTLNAQTGALTAAVSGNVGNAGELSAKTGLTLSASGALTNSGKLVSLADLTLTGLAGGRMGAITNSATGLVNGATGLTLSAQSLTNAGGLGSSSGALTANLGGNLANTGLLISGAASTYSLDGDFTNTGADVIAGTNLTIRGLTGARAGNLTNSSGLIEAQAGDLSINAATITNKRTTNPTIVNDRTVSGPVVIYSTPFDTTGGHPEILDTTATTTTLTNRASGGSVAGQIRSARDMALAAGTLTNAQSQIAANGNLSITANNATNEGIDLIKTVSTVTVNHWIISNWEGSFFGCGCARLESEWWVTNPATVATSTIGAIYGTIEAAGTLTANVTGYVNNNAVRGGAGQVGLSSGKAIASASVSGAASSTTLAAGSATTPSGPGATVPLDTLNVSISGLTGRQATFAPAASPDMPYVIESRSQFIDPSKFLGSDYFLKQLGGYNPETSLKRLGDGYFEYRLVSDQLFAQTGKSTLAGLSDPYRAMQVLYDNALSQQKALSLTAGVSLSPDQVSRLTTDIVWLEKQKVNGADVLVPRLYLASTTLATINVASAEIRGGSLAIQAGGLGNSGALSSDGSIQIASAGSFQNDGGGLFAKNDILIDAAGSVSNRSGVISGDNISIKAASIANDTVSSRDAFATGFADRMQQQARIAARGNLLLSAAGSIQSTGGAMEAGKNLTLQAGSEIAIGALALQSESNSTFKGGYARASSLTNTLASLSAGGNLVLDAGNNLTLAGATAKAEGTAKLQAGNDITLAAVEDRKSQDIKVDSKSSGLFGTSAKVTSSSESGKVQSSSVTAGNGLTLDAGRDVTISASSLDSKKDLGIEAGRNLTIASAVETSSSSFSRKEKGFLSGSSSAQSAYNEKTIGSAITAGGNVDLYADQKAAVSGSNIAAGQALSLTGSSVDVIGAEESHSASEANSKTGLFVGSGGGFFSLYGTKEKRQEQSATVNVASTLKAGTDLSIDAMDKDVNVLGSKLGAGRDLSISAAGDVNVTPGAEQSAALEETKRSGFGISFSSGNGGFSIGLGYNKTADSQSQSANTNALSSLNAGRDLSISSGRDINLQATDARSERDLSLNAVRDVNLLSALDATNYNSLHEQLFAGISLNVSSGLAGATSGLIDASSGLSGKNGVYSLAPTALAAMKFAKAAQAFDPKALQGLTNPSTFGSAMQSSGLGSASLTLGFTSEKTSQSGSNATPVVTTLSAGGSVGVVAQDGSITGKGAQIVAGLTPDGAPTNPSDPTAGNILLSAAKDISLTAASGTSSSTMKSTTASAGLGIDLATFTPVANGSYGRMSGNGSTVTQVDSHVVGTGTVGLTSGKDTTLKGAVVSGESVIANAGGNLSIESTPDLSLYRESSLNLSAGFGPTGFNAGANRGRVNGDYSNVSEQSGIFAGSGGYHIGVDGGVNLVGGVIASTAPKEKNSLLADHLTYSDIGNSSSASISNLGFSLGSSLIPVPNVGQPAEEGDTGAARATLTPGTVTLKNQTQDLASLNTDASKANAQVDGFDIDELKARQKSAAALSELLNTAVGDLSEKLHFAEGSAEKVALHAAVGALVSKLAGGNAATGALAGGASELANGVLQEVLKANPNLTQDQKSAITQWVAVAIGAAAGGEAGAAAGLDNVKYNYLNHSEALALKLAIDQCHSGVKQACEIAANLDALDRSRDNHLREVCSADANGAACKAAISELRQALASLYDNKNNKELDPVTYHWIQLYQKTMGDDLNDPSGGKRDMLAIISGGMLSLEANVARSSASILSRSGAIYDNPSVYVSSRIEELMRQIPLNSRGRITMGVAVAESQNGERMVLIGTSERAGYLRPGVRQNLKPDEIVVSGSGHAEADLVEYAKAHGLKIIDIGATRPVCAGCQSVIPSGTNISTPLK